MGKLKLTIGHEPGAAEGRTRDAAPGATLAELTILLGTVYAARGRLHSHLGEADLALTDLDQALRHDPDNGEARTLRARLRGEGADSAGHDPGAGRPSAVAGDHAGVSRSQLLAGYYVMTTRHPGTVDRLLQVHPLTPEGRAAAIEHAVGLARDPSEREELDARYAVDDPDFDAVVYEVRSIARRVHHASALDRHGRPIER